MDRIGYYIHGDVNATVSLPPELSIWLRVFSSSDGRIFLSPRCANSDEIDFHIDQLQKQLERVRKEGKKALSKAREKERQKYRKPTHKEVDQ